MEKEIRLYATGGLADVLREIYKTIIFAKKKQISTIYLDTEYYDPGYFFKIIELIDKNINLKIYNNENIKFNIIGNDYGFFCKKCKNKQCIFNLKKIPNKSSIKCCFNSLFGAFYLLKSLAFKKEFKYIFKCYKKQKLNFEKYTAIHLRGLDRIHEYEIANVLDSVSKLINKSNIPIYVATDDFLIIEKLLEKTNKNFLYNPIIEKYKNNNLKNLHSHGKKDYFILESAMIDLLVLAGGYNLVTSTGGFSRLALLLWKNNFLYQNLIELKKTNGFHFSIAEDILFKNFDIIFKNYNKKLFF